MIISDEEPRRRLVVGVSHFALSGNWPANTYPNSAAMFLLYSVIAVPTLGTIYVV